MTGPPRETDLYPPVKALLESQGYEVKSEVGAADVFAVREAASPVIVELKLGFSLALFHQGVARLRVTDAVYLAVAYRPGKRFARAVKENTGLARRVGLGLMTVRLRDGLIVVHCDPVPYVPRKTLARKQSLLREFARRKGDPNEGGQTRVGLTTAYRQDARLIAAFLAAHGPSKGAGVAAGTGVRHATRMMADNHYGWFDRVARGVYDLTSVGRETLSDP